MKKLKYIQFYPMQLRILVLDKNKLIDSSWFIPSPLYSVLLSSEYILLKFLGKHRYSAKKFGYLQDSHYLCLYNPCCKDFKAS